MPTYAHVAHSVSAEPARDASEARPLGVGLRVDVGRHRELLLLVLVRDEGSLHAGLDLSEASIAASAVLREL